MPESFEQKLIKIKPEDVVDELYGAPKTEGQRKLDEFRKKSMPKQEGTTAIENEFKEFLTNILEETFDKENAASAHQEAILIAPESQNYRALARGINPAKVVTYTLNPETQGLDFEQMKTFIPDTSSFKEKPFYELMEHVMNTYGNAYHIPGVEYWRWLYENPDKIPSFMKNDDGYFFPGSVLCLHVDKNNHNSYWCVPGVSWEEHAKLTPGAISLTRKEKWFNFYHVVLFEK